MNRIRGFMGDDRGATAVEYGLIMALIFLAMVSALVAFADGTISMWDDVATKVASS